MASIPKVTSWYNMAAGTPAIMPTVQKAGQKKEKKEAISVCKLSFNGSLPGAGTQYLPYIPLARI